MSCCGVKGHRSHLLPRNGDRRSWEELVGEWGCVKQILPLFAKTVAELLSAVSEYESTVPVRI